MPLNESKLRKLVGAIDPSKKVDYLSDDIRLLEQKLLDKLDNFSRDLRAELTDKVKSWPQVPDLTNSLKTLQDELDNKIEGIKKEFSRPITPEKKENIDEKLEALKTEFFSKLYTRGGGNANFSVNINSSLASARYADINFQQFGNIGWTATNDDVLKRVNIRASILGGDGAGITRTVSILSVSSTLGANTSTDYVFMANVGVNLTLPTAVGNTNMYTIKNQVASSVLISTTGGQTIDGDTSKTLNIQYASLDLVSDSSNWNIT